MAHSGVAPSHPRDAEHNMSVSVDQLRKAVDGDFDALTDLLRLHGPTVERTLRIDKAWRAYLDPADVMQVTYIEAFRHIREFDAARADRFESWLRQMAENNLRDAIRGLTRAKRGGANAGRAGVTDPDGNADIAAQLVATLSTPSRAVRRAEHGDQLAKALDRLPPDYARVVRLMDLESRPVGEVAAELGRSAGAVHMLRARAYDRLRELLGPPSAFLTSS